ncbi:precorrin-8X methylmutase [Desulfonema ishimotonii]|uniref:Precorrin-8X methylmutase n=1 Tax=Desulfonema ishimotonii TaxID=45657 RepID=A0A401G481_9BACT|nr:precorrin-8X methylmutase [Desulfonema ishimotonii]GBC64047.1 precorrin-8X methylmutase [Desulfonema ishimotonii]
MKPHEIETLSFTIIDEEAGPHDFSGEEWQIVRRMIHTSADFEYMESVRFHPEAIDRGIEAIRSGKPIFTDTEMARSGLRKKELGNFGVTTTCLISNADVSRTASESGKTRAHVAVDTAAPLMTGGIYVVGNAPTALLRLLELVREGRARPALIIGLPVGFVNAAESKAALIETGYPHISNIGRKGGSNLAASVVNALSIMATARS